MSGGNCPETPRQKMIGMMYLMLTAMLALNVSGDLLNAFILVDQSILKSTEMTEGKNVVLYNQFEAAAAQNPAKAGDKFKLAKEVEQKANEMNDLIYGYKELMVKTADVEEATPENYLSTSNQDVAAQVMMVEDMGSRGKNLRESINKYRDYLIGVVDNDSMMTASLNKMLNTDDPKSSTSGESTTWLSQTFEHIPLAASMALMSRLQSDVRNAQADVVSFLYRKIDEASFKFNAIVPLVIPESNYVLRGNSYKADIMLAAYDETMAPIVTVGDAQVPVVEGRGKYERMASSVGQQSFEAVIEVKDPVTGAPRPYTVKAEYEVGEPSVVIAATKMNVLYEGLDNPVSISAAGISASDLKIQVDNATYVKAKNGYVIKPKNGSAGKTAKITVSADLNGKVQRLGSMDFRIKRVPTPFAVIAGLNGGTIKKSVLSAQGGVFAEMGDDFDFELEFKVTNFTLSTIKNGFIQELKSNSSSFTADMRQAIKGLQRGSKFYIEGIKATGPGGSRKLSSLAFTVD